MIFLSIIYSTQALLKILRHFYSRDSIPAVHSGTVEAYMPKYMQYISPGLETGRSTKAKMPMIVALKVSLL
jgi:hypothetical protein